MSDIRQIQVDLLDPNPWQPRIEFDEKKLRGLADSVRKDGVFQELKARPVGEGKQLRYQLLFGERRLRACKLAGIPTVPVIVVQADDATMQRVALAENVQREDLKPTEEARAYRGMLELYDNDLSKMSEEVGKDPDTIVDRIALLSLPGEVQTWVDSGSLKLGCAKVLCDLTVASDQVKFARLAMMRNMNPAQLQGTVQGKRSKHPKAGRKAAGGQHIGRGVNAKSVAAALVAAYTTIGKFMAQQGDTLTPESAESLMHQVSSLQDKLVEFHDKLAAGRAG